MEIVEEKQKFIYITGLTTSMKSNEKKNMKEK